MKRILWLSRHLPLPVQEAELECLLGEVKLCDDVNPFVNAEEVKQRDVYRHSHRGEPSPGRSSS